MILKWYARWVKATWRCLTCDTPRVKNHASRTGAASHARDKPPRCRRSPAALSGNSRRPLRAQDINITHTSRWVSSSSWMKAPDVHPTDVCPGSEELAIGGQLELEQVFDDVPRAEGKTGEENGCLTTPQLGHFAAIGPWLCIHRGGEWMPDHTAIRISSQIICGWLRHRP